MKQSRIFSFILIIFFLFLSSPSVEAQGAARPITTIQPDMQLFNYLQILGNKFDCYFTLEGGYAQGESIAAFQIRRVSNSGFDLNARLNSYPEIEIALIELQQSFPDFSYRIDSNNPKIIHIIDTRLEQQSNPLNTVLPSINFYGTVGELLDAIGKQESRIRPQISFGTIDMNFKDFRSIAQVQATSLTIREVLSNSIELKRRKSRVLWLARTELGKDKITYIYYVDYPPQPNFNFPK